MSVNIPILDEGVPVNQLGSEFNMYQSDQRDRGLISPTIRDPVYSSSNTTVSYRPDGELWNQQTLFENNHNPKELMRFTDAQSLQKLLDNSAYERAKTEVEKQLELTEDFDLDPELRGRLLQESLKDGSDIFHVKSKDYVDEVQESIRQYDRERNLYLLKAQRARPTSSGAELLKAGGVGDLEDLLELAGGKLPTKKSETGLTSKLVNVLKGFDPDVMPENMKRLLEQAEDAQSKDESIAGLNEAMIEAFKQAKINDDLAKLEGKPQSERMTSLEGIGSIKPFGDITPKPAPKKSKKKKSSKKVRVVPKGEL
jgi:hypothetical protein